MQYFVEFMKGDKPISSKTVEAGTPLSAAVVASGRDVAFTIDREDWVRVTPPGRPSFEYGYARKST